MIFPTQDLFLLMDAWAYSIGLAHLSFTTASSADAQVEGVRNLTMEFNFSPDYPMDPGLAVYN